MDLEAKAEMVKKFLEGFQVFPESSVKFSICGAEVATAAELVEDLIKIGEIIRAGFTHWAFSKRNGRAIRITSARG